MHTRGYAALSQGARLTPFAFERRDLRSTDVAMEILYCGICHSDLHMAENDWGFGMFPMVPGHEIVGRVIATGSAVHKFKVNDIAAVGCMSDSCRTCQHCEQGLEQYCENYLTPSFNAYERGTTNIVHGGFSKHYVVDERFALRVPSGVDLARTAPLLCAGITAYSPLKHWNVSPGQMVGIAGIGGLGHLAIKFARSFGARVVAISRSGEKLDDAKRLGAHDGVLSGDSAEMAKYSGQMDFILDTISAAHEIDPMLGLLKTDGTLCLVGIPVPPLAFHAMGLAAGRKRIAGSGMGGLPETQEMLDFAAQRGVEADIEVLPIDRVNDAFDRLRRSDVRYRFVIDMASLSP